MINLKLLTPPQLLADLLNICGGPVEELGYVLESHVRDGARIGVLVSIPHELDYVDLLLSRVLQLHRPL